MLRLWEAGKTRPRHIANFGVESDVPIIFYHFVSSAFLGFACEGMAPAATRETLRSAVASKQSDIRSVLALLRHVCAYPRFIVYSDPLLARLYPDVLASDLICCAELLSRAHHEPDQHVATVCTNVA